MLENAVHICGAEFRKLPLFDGMNSYRRHAQCSSRTENSDVQGR